MTQLSHLHTLLEELRRSTAEIEPLRARLDASLSALEGLWGRYDDPRFGPAMERALLACFDFVVGQGALEPIRAEILQATTAVLHSMTEDASRVLRGAPPPSGPATSSPLDSSAPTSRAPVAALVTPRRRPN